MNKKDKNKKIKNSGKTAMQDTIGQASALTGGYGSTYATSAGNQAYNAFIEDAYNNIDEYYRMAMEAYQMEGEEMFNQLGMFVDADNREYQRTYDAWSANFANAESMYNKEYGQWQDSVKNAFHSANLQLNEYGTRLDASSKLYDVYANQANTNYQREYQSWADEVAQAQNMINILHSDWQYDTNLQYQKDRDAVADAQWEKSYALEEKYTNAQIAKMNSSGGGGGGTKKTSDSIPSEITKEVKAAKNNEARLNYVADLVDKGYLTDEQGSYLLDTYNQAELQDRVWEVESKGGWNWGGGVDRNAKVTDQYDNTYSMEDLWDELSKTMGKDAAEDWIIKLQKEKGITW